MFKLLLIVVLFLKNINGYNYYNNGIEKCQSNSTINYCSTIIKNGRVFCTGEKIPNNSKHVKELIICRWPKIVFDLELLEEFDKLNNLTIRNSNISIIKNTFPKNVRNLQVLILFDLKLETFDSNFFINFQQLKYLDIRNNKIQTIDMFLFNNQLLKDIYLGGNPWKCETNLTWILDDSRIKDRENMFCNNFNSLYPDKPLLPIMQMLKLLQSECTDNCSCIMTNAVYNPKGQLVPLIYVNCSKLGLTDIPLKIPFNTTTLNLKYNKITTLKSIRENEYYLKVVDIYLDYNLISSVGDLEGARWLESFRVFSLRGNLLTQLPTYAFDSALQYNRNALHMYLSNNPWICDCEFTPGFKDFLIKYQSIIEDLNDIKCAYDGNNKNSLKQIRELSNSDFCRDKNNGFIAPLDLLNIILASLIIFVLSKLAYDYYNLKKTGKLPWIVRRMP